MRKVAFALGVLLFSCADGRAEPRVGTTMTAASTSKKKAADEPGSLPCAVDNILRAKCLECHGHPTANTAPMSLTSFEELHAQAPSKRDMPAKVFERMATRLHDRLRPMPPRDRPPLTEHELSVLDVWLTGGAQSGEPCSEPRDAGEDESEASTGSKAPSAMANAADAAAPAKREQPKTTSRSTDAGMAEQREPSDEPAREPMQPSADSGMLPDAGQPTATTEQPPDASECDYVEIRAQKDAMGTPYDVPADATDLYQCFLIDLAFDAPKQGLAFEHLPGNEGVVHHWMLRTLGESDRKPGTLITCDDLYPTNKLVASWTPGGANWYLPKDVGLDLGRGLFILEIHYNNIGNPATTDRTGVRVCTSKAPRPNTASISWLGSQLFTVPPRSADYPVSSRCRPTRQTEPLQLLQVTPHMHLHGVRATMRLDRADGTSEMLFDEPFAFGSEKSYRNLGQLNVGDTLVSTCYYDNPDNTTLRMGVKTTDEMCHFFVAAYPPYQLVSDTFSLENDACLGPP